MAAELRTMLEQVRREAQAAGDRTEAAERVIETRRVENVLLRVMRAVRGR
jgi:hypothetical protein